MRALLEHRRLDPEGGWYWHYSVQEEVPNDLAHAGYIVDGIRTYASHGGRLAERFEWAAVRDHLHTFFSEDGEDGILQGWPAFSGVASGAPARSYGLGMALALASRLDPDPAFAERIAGRVFGYRTATGEYAKYPPPRRSFFGRKLWGRERRPSVAAGPPLVVQEYQAYVLYGLSSFLFGRESGSERESGGTSPGAAP